MKNLSKTAFLIAWGRAQYPTISLDSYASFWLTPDGIEFAEKFAQAITPLAPYFHSLRNRYLVEQLKSFEKDHPHFSLINVGSDITSYPFLLSKNIETYELDQEHVLEFRKTKISEGIQKNIIPKRTIHFFPVDLNANSGAETLRGILTKQSGPSFVLFEGVLPYLEKPRALELIRLCANKLPRGSRVIVHVFLEGYAISEIRKKVVRFFNEELGLANHNFTYFSQKELENISDLKLIEHVGFDIIQERHTPKKKFNREDLIDERFFLFEKQ